VRIVAGRFGGRRIAVPPGRGTRPTSDRVREALFSMLGPLDGERVLDAFAGSGALGLEALSRGAASAVFVEQDARAADVVRANIAALGLPGEQAQVLQAPLAAALRTAPASVDAYSLVFLDPPYRQAPALGDELATMLAPLLAPGARVVTESDRRAPLDLPLFVTHDRRYGDTLIRIHQA
jgi:16S rRNA (guanine966-N2)-methyltransferase